MCKLRYDKLLLYYVCTYLYVYVLHTVCKVKRKYQTARYETRPGCTLFPRSFAINKKIDANAMKKYNALLRSYSKVASVVT